VPCILSKKTYTLSKQTYILLKNFILFRIHTYQVLSECHAYRKPYILSTAPCYSSNEPCFLLNEPYIQSSTAVCLIQKSLDILSQNGLDSIERVWDLINRALHSMKEPFTPCKEPYIISKEPYLLSKEPYIPWKDPCILSNEPCILSEKSLDSAKRAQKKGLDSVKAPFIIKRAMGCM